MTDATVADVMTRCLVSVRPDAPLATVAALLARGGISAVPVVDECGAPIGVVAEIDLMRAGGDRRTAGDVMSGPVRTVAAGESVSTAARLLGESGVRRLFVVEAGRLAGVLARRDLLRTYLRGDDEIRAQVESTVRGLVPDTDTVNAVVADGVVLLLGRVQWRSQVDPLGVAASVVPGVVEVCNRVGFVWDDAPARGRRFARSIR
jgi:predicted transcriptional regulator